MNYQEPIAEGIKIAQEIVIVHPQDKTKFLLLKRFKENKSQILYDLPGGGFSKGELHEESLRREIMEETRLEVSEIFPNEIQSRIQPSGTLFLYLGYAAIAKTTDVVVEQDEDIDAFVWITLEEFEKEAGEHIILNQARNAIKRLSQ